MKANELIAEVVQPALETPAAPPVVAEIPVSPNVVQVAEEFIAYKREVERIETLMKRIRPFLESELAKLPENAVAVGAEKLVLITLEKETCDLEAAKAKLGARKLNPFIKVVETLDLKAATNYLGKAALKKFLTVSTVTQLRVQKLKEK